MSIFFLLPASFFTRKSEVELSQLLGHSWALQGKENLSVYIDAQSVYLSISIDINLYTLYKSINAIFGHRQACSSISGVVFQCPLGIFETMDKLKNIRA